MLSRAKLEIQAVQGAPLAAINGERTKIEKQGSGRRHARPLVGRKAARFSIPGTTNEHEVTRMTGLRRDVGDHRGETWAAFGVIFHELHG